MTTPVVNKKSKSPSKKSSKKAYLTTARLKSIVKKAFGSAHEKALAQNGFVVVFEKGQVVKKFKDGSVEVLPSSK